MQNAYHLFVNPFYQWDKALASEVLLFFEIKNLALIFILISVNYCILNIGFVFPDTMNKQFL